MKKVFIVFLVFSLLFLFGGCSEISKEDYDALVSERDALKEELEQLQSNYDSLEMKYNSLLDDYANEVGGARFDDLMGAEDLPGYGKEQIINEYIQDLANSGVLAIFNEETNTLFVYFEIASTYDQLLAEKSQAEMEALEEMVSSALYACQTAYEVFLMVDSSMSVTYCIVTLDNEFVYMATNGEEVLNLL